jgi:DNA-binding NarL/FixJ family response regulator
MTRRPLHRRWTPEEDARLLTLVGEGKRNQRIAVLLRRSPAAISARKSDLLREQAGKPQRKS